MAAIRSATSRPMQLSYASDDDTKLRRWFIRSVEGVSGRNHYADLYDEWCRTVVPTGERIFAQMLALVGITLRASGSWPPANLPDGPLVIVANHPFGIGDGIAVLSLAEQLGRPFRVMIHKDLLRIGEMAPFALPVDFCATKEALHNNVAVRHRAVQLLREGVTIVVFPAGGVATAPGGFGKARDLPWKMFPARLVRDAKASVIPLHFDGQNGRLFHLVSKPMALACHDNRVKRMVGRASLTLRLSLLVREFSRLSGRTLDVRIGPTLSWAELEPLRERKQLLDRLQEAVLSLAPVAVPISRRFPARFRMQARAGTSVGGSQSAPSTASGASSLASTSTS